MKLKIEWTFLSIDMQLMTTEAKDVMQLRYDTIKEFIFDSNKLWFDWLKLKRCFNYHIISLCLYLNGYYLYSTNNICKAVTSFVVNKLRREFEINQGWILFVVHWFALENKINKIRENEYCTHHYIMPLHFCFFLC